MQTQDVGSVKCASQTHKIIQKLYFLWFTYIGLLIFYTKLTHLTQKFKKKKKKD